MPGLRTGIRIRHAGHPVIDCRSGGQPRAGAGGTTPVQS